MKWLFVVVLICLLVSVGSGADFEETWQYSTYTGDWVQWTTSGGDHGAGGGGSTTWTSNLPSGYPYMKGIDLYAHSHHVYYLGTYYGGSGSINIRTLIPAESTYWSVRYWRGTGGTGSSGVRLYDNEKNLITSCTLGTGYNYGVSSGFLEFIQTGSGIYFYKDGVSQSMLTSSHSVPAYIGFWAASSSGGTPDHYDAYFDDVTTKDGLVALGTENGNINRTFTEAMNYELDMTWHTNSIPTYEYTAAQYDMEVRRSTWGEIYDTQRIKNATEDASVVLPYGAMKYNWSELFKTNHYGLYWFKLLKTESGESEAIGMDWLFFNDLGEPSTINIEDTEYAVGEAMNISYYIDDPDFGANQYKIQIFDSTGQLKDERTLTMQAATEQMTSTIDWEEGMMYAVLVEDSKPHITEDPPEDIRDLAYDFCTLSSVIYITGKVWDASNSDMLVDGTLLDNVSLNWTQAGTIYNTTSDANGNYEFIDATTLLEVEWFQDVPITVHVEKTGYTHSDFDMTIIKAGRYVVDIYMMPALDYENISISGVVADDIFHQSLPHAEVHIWNATWSKAMYTNTWGWYEFNNLTNGTYNMYAKKETYRDSSVVQVKAWNISLTLDSCDSLDYIESTLDECDATTGWTSDNTLTLNTTDYIESTGSLQSVGANTMDFNKTFSPAFDSNVSKTNGNFYFYSKINNITNISSVNVTVTLSSNASGATDTIIWEINKTLFSNVWDLTFLPLSQATETGTCDLSAIRFFELESTKSASVTIKIDFLAFIEYVNWNSNLNLSTDTSDKQEGAASILMKGKAWIPNPYVWKGPGGGIPTAEYYVERYWSAPGSGDSKFSTTNSLGRVQMWYKPGFTSNRDVILASGDTTNYLYWENVGSVGSWTLERLFFENAYENDTMDLAAIKWFVITGNRSGIADVNERIDNIRLVQAGETRQNFYLSQNYNLTVYAKDMDTRFTITTFTAILDSTTVAETTTGAIVFPNVTYGIYPLEVSANGYYTNKQYVFMGGDTTQTVYLTKIENVSGEGVGQYYAPPHLVEFRVENIWGRPYENVYINVTAEQTTMGMWEWLASVFGYRTEIAAEIQNGTMNGTTDTYGAMSFMMTETIKYKVHAYNATQGIDKIVYVYPKEERYIIVCSVIRWEQNGTEEMRELSINVTTSTINDTHANITVEYYDPSNATTDLTFYINRTTNYNDQELVASYNVLDDSNETYNFTVTPISGRSFFVRVATVNDEWGSKVWDFAVKFPGLLIDLGLPSIAYPMMAIALILFTGGLFGASSATQGSLICCLEGWLFLGMGWFATVASSVTITMALSLATIISILAIVIEKGRRTGVQ